MNQHISNTDSDEIDLIALLAQLWQGRKTIVLTTVVFGFIGFMVAIFSPVTYQSETTFVPQTSEKGGVSSSLSGLAAIAGINLGSAEVGNQIPPSLYPSIIESTSFKKAFLNTPVTVKGTQILVKDYLTQNASGPSLLSSVLGAVKSIFSSTDQPEIIEADTFISLDQIEYDLSKSMEELLSVTVNEKEGFVSLSMIDGDPYMAAVLTKAAFSLLQTTVIDFKIENAKKLYDFVSTQYDIKQKEFEKIQTELALFSDRNKNITTALFDSERQRLQTAYDLSYALYQELAKQKAQAELQLSKDTPIFSIIKPISPPKEKQAPKRALILVIYTFLGAVLATGFVLVKKPLKEIVSAITSGKSS